MSKVQLGRPDMAVFTPAEICSSMSSHRDTMSPLHTATALRWVPA